MTNDKSAYQEAMKNVVWRQSYKPFCEPLVITGPAALDARFPGQWFQFESGLSWNWYRHYDASLGRYTQPDPLGVSQGSSLYGYAGQSPLMGVDPQGRFFWLVPAAIIAAAILSPEIANAPGRQDTPIPASPLSPYVNGIAAGSLVCVGAEAFAARVRLAAQEEAFPVIEMSSSRFGQAAEHIADAQSAGQPNILTIDRLGAAANRVASTGGIPKVPGMHLD